MMPLGSFCYPQPASPTYPANLMGAIKAEEKSQTLRAVCAPVSDTGTIIPGLRFG